MSPEGHLGLICSPSHFFLLDTEEQIVDVSLSGGLGEDQGVAGGGGGDELETFDSHSPGLKCPAS